MDYPAEHSPRTRRIEMRAVLLSMAGAMVMAVVTPAAAAPPPELGSWILNTDGHTGYAGILADVQAVYFSDGYVYVECTGIPSYTIGPWPGNPNNASNQNWRFKITRNPVAAASHTATPLGQVGVWSNGVVMFNAR